jgi:hypothetical protein
VRRSHEDVPPQPAPNCRWVVQKGRKARRHTQKGIWPSAGSSITNASCHDRNNYRRRSVNTVGSPISRNKYRQESNKMDIYDEAKPHYFNWERWRSRVAPSRPVQKGGCKSLATAPLSSQSTPARFCSQRCQPDFQVAKYNSAYSRLQTKSFWVVDSMWHRTPRFAVASKALQHWFPSKPKFPVLQSRADFRTRSAFGIPIRRWDGWKNSHVN